MNSAHDPAAYTTPVVQPMLDSRVMKPTSDPRVIIRNCAGYDPEAIRAIVRDGLDELGLKPSGRTLVKPNLVAAGKLFPHAHTRPEFGEGVLRALREAGGDAIT